uniref:Uncharacterized protein n=1 Tax=Arundo donax TaxID=35708 RepID=A0A0A8ZUS9_ARUDO
MFFPFEASLCKLRSLIIIKHKSNIRV